MSKVVRLQAENLLRLVAIDITPEGDLITIGGKNSAGKSSVLNSIAMALGGADLCPLEPIRNGEAEGKVTLDIGDLVVTRRFSREYLPCDCGASTDIIIAAGPQITKDTHVNTCSSKRFGETKSTLSVTNRDGAKYPSPQAVLNKLLGALTFDPLAFTKSENQAETLRKLVKLDTSMFDAARKDASAKRLMLKKSFDIKQAQLLSLPFYKDVPQIEVPLATISKEMEEAERYRRIAEKEEQFVKDITTDVNVVDRDIREVKQRVGVLQTQLREAEIWLARLVEQNTDRLGDLEAKKITAEAARSVVPDVEILRKKLTDTEAINTKVRANLKRMDAVVEIDALKAQIDEQTDIVRTSDEAKQAALEAVVFPIDGLGIENDVVTFNDLPLSQASTSEQLRISVAIGISLNPKLKILLVRNGNALDEDGMALLTKQAQDAGMQTWVEFVTGKAGDVSVMIEEGRVKA